MKILLAVLILALALSFSSCSNADSNSSPVSTNAANTVVERKTTKGTSDPTRASSPSAMEAEASSHPPAADMALSSEIQEQFKVNRIDGIRITANNGEVTLTGRVGDESKRQLAERIATNTNGVTRVRNEVRVVAYELATPAYKASPYAGVTPRAMPKAGRSSINTNKPGGPRKSGTNSVNTNKPGGPRTKPDLVSP